jgi:hypothetical protein
MSLESRSFIFREIRSLSFSRFRLMRECLRKGGVLTQSVLRHERGKTRSQIVGRLFHSMMERVGSAPPVGISNRAQLREQFNDALNRITAEIEGSEVLRHLGNPRDWSEVSTAYVGLRDLLDDAVGGRWLNRESLKSEKRFYSGDGLLFGDIDAYVERDDGIELIDYKTGLSDSSPDLDSRFVDQLHFYAYLIHENLGRFPARMLLVGKDGRAFDVPLVTSRALQLADEMREALGAYNDLVRRNEGWIGGSPTVEACQFCDRMSWCDNFFQKLPELRMPDGYHVVLGYQVGPMSTSENGATRLSIRVSCSSFQSAEIRIHRIYTDRFPQLSDRVGQRLLITNLRRTSEAENDAAEATQLTSIVVMEE